MGPFYIDLKSEQDNIHLSVGDLLVDNVSGGVGVLLKRERRISIEDDDIYIWHIFWSVVGVSDFILGSPDNIENENLIFLEEEGLKISIIIDYYEHVKRSEIGNNL